ncbi:Glucosidase_II_beta_subunit-like (plasmid) [Leishmania braziliensis MHOM/BR/75/M2904]|nr:Glucosidase_II_beta_subunit-like [Leishmania braziliensis MHOM/BR/75/M2904]
MAGKGREWFPMWMSNFIISALTARRVTDEDDAGGGGSFGEHFDQRRGLAPPQLIRSKRAPPLVPEGATSGSGSAVAENTSISATQTSPSTRLRCYTLEDYSATFLHPRRMSTPPPLFSCGTRVVDLRSEGRPEVRAACQAGLGVAWRRTGSADSNRESDSLFPTLRVVLTPREVRWHSDVQPVNVVSQRIPLSRVNDDYCDCLDGTDELLTNACSMSGPLTPAAGTRWKSYLISNQQLRLWEADDVIAQEDAEARGYPLQRRKHGDVGDRLYVSTGPVLPFVCTCGTVTQLLAPSLVGDGIVDCCAAEDEVVLQGTPYDGASPHRLSGDPAIVEANDRALEAARAAMLVLWKQRRVSASQYKIATPSPYADRLYPHHTSARAMLVDKGYYSLYTSLEVQQEKQAAAAVLEGIYAHGHQIQRDRVERGWDQLGRHLVDNRTQLQLQLSNVTRELESLEEYVRYRMGEARTNDPLAAGVPMHHLQHHARLMHMHDVLTSEVQHISLTTLHRAYGDHYEYYPLARRIMHLEASHLVDPSTSTTLDPATALQREARIITPTEVERRNTAAYAAQQPPPPLHVDNISVSDYGLEVMHQVFVAQRFDSREAPLVAQRLGLLPSHDISAYTPDIFNRTTSPFQRAPVIPIGSWQPYQSHRNSRVMVIADPAGDVHLARRACVTPASTLFRGGGRLQWPTRYPEAPHAVSVADAEEVKKTPKDKLKAASAGETAKVSQRYIPHHTNTPSVFAVDVYTGGIHCEPDRLQGPGRTLQIHVAYLCDPEDGILHWAKNGKCLQEVVIGTPSACTAWAWKVATNRLKEVGKAAKV